jgi:plasmid stabilization system protein ParE
MTYRLRIEAAAEEDLDAAIAWYEERKETLGARFLAAALQAMRLIAANPFLGAKPPAVADEDTRRVLVKKFPYAIVYYVEGDEVRVVAVAHGKQEPEYWKSR